MAYLYASSPTKAIVGTCRITHIETCSPSQLWARHGPATGITRAEFRAYFSRCEQAHALHITDPLSLGSPVELEQMRLRWRGFHPPQSFRYLTPSLVATLQLTA